MLTTVLFGNKKGLTDADQPFVAKETNPYYLLNSRYPIFLYTLRFRYKQYKSGSII